ncbi:MAG: HAD family hydrolase [Hydrogenophilales bacterium]|nr:HAD family hydrolase [Hydrogenophilales bacterium]
MKRPHRVLDFVSLRAWLEARLGQYDCVSFDVFDTLLARCIEPPDDLQRRVAQLLASRLGDMSVDHVLQCRRDVEWELRRAALLEGQDHECHFDPLVEGWVTRLTGSPEPELIRFVHDTERTLETLALFAKPGVHALLDWLKSKGLRVIAVSDMYLSHDHVMALLEDAGLAGHVDQAYVSSEFGLGKYSGRLHAKVLELEGLAPERVVHVGDNLVSDMRAPLQLGIQGLFLDEKHERLRRRKQTLSAEMARVGGMWPGRRFFEIVDFRMEHDPACQEAFEDFYHYYGAHVLGPAFSTFLMGLLEKFKDVKPEKVFFLARDGYLFEKLYARWRELEPNGMQNWPEPVYVYASRRVVASASVAEGLSPDQAQVAFYNPKQQGLLSVLKTFGLPAADYEEAAREHGLADIAEPLHDWRDPRFLAFLADDSVQTRIKSFGEAARERLQGYFEQHGFFECTRVALVDIGWNGTIQKFLRDSFESRPDYPDVHGWYFAFLGAIHGDFGMGDRIEGLILDVRRGDPYERAVMDFEEIFEQGARSGEATTLGYRDGEGGRVEPVLKGDDAPDRQGELACNPMIDGFQRGVLDHLGHFHAATKLTGYGFQDIKPYVLALLERAVASPTQEEVEHITRLVHTEDFGHDHTLSISLEPVRYLDVFAPRSLFRKLRHKPWKFAAFAHFGWRLPAWLFRMAYFHLITKRGF